MLRRRVSGGRLYHLGNSLQIAARTTSRPTLLPHPLPIPHPGRHPVRQREPKLMREHAHLPAMVSFMSNHVTQHLRPNRPGSSPPVPLKRLDAATTAERFGEHLRASCGALGQSRTSLLRRAVRPVKLSWNLQVRSGQPHPLRPHIVHVRKDRRNRPDPAGRFRSPRNRVKMLEKHLIHPLIRGKDPHRRWAE
jgi:hypothetical protein